MKASYVERARRGQKLLRFEVLASAPAVTRVTAHDVDALESRLDLVLGVSLNGARCLDGLLEVQEPMGNADHLPVDLLLLRVEGA